MSQNALASGLAALDITLAAEAQHKLLAFRDLLLKWNKTYNLTALRDPAQAISHHLLDSLAILPHVGTGNLLDVGSGGGLPGIPLAIANLKMIPISLMPLGKEIVDVGAAPTSSTSFPA